MRTHTLSVQVSSDDTLHGVVFGSALSVIEDAGHFVITDDGTTEGELFRSPSKVAAEERLPDYVIDPHLRIKGDGQFAGRKFWELSDDLQSEIISCALPCAPVDVAQTVNH